MILLENCIRQLEANDVFKSEVWRSVVDNPELKVIELSNVASQEAFEALNLSLLSGEYIQTLDPEEGIRIINRLKASINSLPGILEIIGDETVREGCQFYLLQYFIDPLLQSLRMYQHLIFELNKKTKHEDVLFNVWWKQKPNNELSDYDRESFQLSEIFLVNIQIARIDHSLSVDRKQLQDLLIAKRRLEEKIKINPFYKDILIDKSDYLIRKINYRFQEDEKNYSYAFEFQDSKVAAPNELKYFKSFHDKTKQHYNIEGGVLEKEWSKLYDKIIKDEVTSFIDFHTILQFYKDVAQDKTRTNNLREKFEERCSVQLRNKNCPFDNEAISIDKNYFANNAFSILLSDKETTFQDGLRALKELRVLQIETGVKNYFPFLRFCEFLCERINDKLPSYTHHEIEVQEYFDSLNLAIKEAFKAFEWCKDSKFLAFQLPIAEASFEVRVQDKEIKLFLASGFVLPLNYVKILRDLKDVEKKIDSFKAIIEVHRTISHEKNEINKIRSEVEKIDRRSIEIIAIFAAIVLFTSGSIQIFSIPGITIKDGLSWMLMFSYSLILFVFVIWLITREGIAIKNLSSVHWVFFCGLVAMWALSILYIFKLYPF